MTKKKMVLARVTDMNVSRQQYKPYTYNLQPLNLMVELPLDVDTIIEDGDDVVITLDGFTALLGKVATSLDDMHKQYEYKLTGVKR